MVLYSFRFRLRAWAWLLVVLVACSGSPVAVAATPGGSRARPHTIGRISEYLLPKGYVASDAITGGPDGNVWFTDTGPSGEQVSLARITPQGHITEYPVPGCSGGSSAITVGPDGNLWAMACFPLTVVSLNPTTGQMTTYSYQFNYAGPAITVGPDGNLWLLEDASNNTIDRFSLRTHTLTQFAIPTPTAEAYGLTTGADGNVWFTEFSGNKLGKLDPQTGQITEYALPFSGEGPQTITPGPRGDSHLWFVSNIGLLGWIDPFSGHLVQQPTPNGVGGPGLSAGPDGQLWFFEGGSRGIARIARATPGASLRFVSFVIPTRYCHPQAITVGPDGNMWFTENYGNKIGMVTTR